MDEKINNGMHVDINVDTGAISYIDKYGNTIENPADSVREEVLTNGVRVRNCPDGQVKTVLFASYPEHGDFDKPLSLESQDDSESRKKFGEVGNGLMVAGALAIGYAGYKVGKKVVSLVKRKTMQIKQMRTEINKDDTKTED